MHVQVRYINVEYLAFGLLGLGTIFILIGITAARQEKSPKFIEKSEKRHFVKSFSGSEPSTQDKSPDIVNQEEIPANLPEPVLESYKPTFSEPIISKKTIIPPLPVIPYPEKKITVENNEKNDSPLKNIVINSTKQQALFFKEDAILYIDRNRNNIYEDNQLNSRLINTGDIHRIGSGSISFDGFKFFFEDRSIHEIYDLSDIDSINFYSNCFTITRKKTGVTSIFFIDSTVRIKAILDNHRMIHAS